MNKFVDNRVKEVSEGFSVRKNLEKNKIQLKC